MWPIIRPAAWAVVLVAASARASDLPIRRVVVSDPGLASLFAAGYKRSETIRRLSHDLEASGWTIFVLAGPCPVKEATGCLLHTVGTFEGRPYLRVKVRIRERHPDVVLATIAHELQHAFEVASSGNVHDNASLLELFRTLGGSAARGSGGVLYETKAAREIEAQVVRELRRSPRQGTIGAPSPDRPPN